MVAKVKTHRFYVCPHTHWDREWYGSFEDFRMRLVELTDEMLDSLQDEPEFRCFHFDGQAIVLRDYLAIRPERRDDIRKLVTAGRLTVGPWYVLPDEFLVSGEALVRNLQLGHRTAGEFGRVLKVGYLPDTFGHVSQIPQILQGFGIDTFVFWRGWSPAQDATEVLVEGPDGSRVQGYHFGPDGYCDLGFFAHQAPPEVQAMLAGEGGRPNWSTRAKFLTMRHVAEQAVARDQARVHLLMNGCDHMRIHKDLPDVIRRANDELEDWFFQQATLEEFLDALKAEKGKWPVIRTPLRETTGAARSHAFLLAGVLSARMHLKQANERCQTLLERWVGPWETLCWLEGGAYERAFIDYAWELLLQNHPHDSICGCSADAVHREMETRFARCEEVGRQLLRRAQAAIAARIDTSFARPHEGALIVFNPLPRPTAQLIEARLEMDAAHVRIEEAPGGPPAVSFAPLASASEVARAIRGVRLFDHEGREIECGVDSIDLEVTNEPWGVNDGASVIHHRLVARARFWAEDLPALGYRAYRFHFTGRPTSRRGGLVVAPNVMENESLRVTIGPDGSVTVSDKQAGESSAPTLWFEDGGDAGDSYNFARPVGDRIVTTLGGPAQVALVEDSPAAAIFEIRQRLDVPARFDFERRARSAATVALDLTTRVTLGAGARYVAFRTHVRNTARDHRLRAVFRPAHALAPASLVLAAEGPFDVVEWPIAPPHPNPDAWVEEQPVTIPQQSFVDLSDGRWGLALFNGGLPEVEAVNRPEPRLYLTLWRSFGHISRPDNPARARPAGPALATPEGQCLREMTFEYAAFPHGGRWDEADVLALAHEFVAGVEALAVAPREGVMPARLEFLRLEGDPAVALSAFERARDGEGAIVRLWNRAARKHEARLVFDRPLHSAHSIRLDETVLEALKIVRRREVALQLEAKKIATIKIVYAK